VGFAGAEGSLYKTVDTGLTWTTEITGASFSAIHFPNDSTGYFIGGSDFGNPLYKTVDAGQSFLPITNGFQSIKEAVYFISDTIGYMCGWYNSMLVKTTNGGMSWQQFGSINPSCLDVYFANENSGYYLARGIIAHTTDGGGSWTTQLNGVGIWLNTFFFIDSNTAIAVGDSGTIYKMVEEGGVKIREVEQKIKPISFHPNPASENVRIELLGLGQITSIQLIDLKGKLVRKYLASDRVLSVMGIPKGKYILSVNAAGKSYSEKIIVH
jgi:photosystem II stability/assembly factor-like uncharacterized protein